MAGIFSWWGWWSRSLCPGGVNPPFPTNPEHESVRDFRIFAEKTVYFKWKSVESERLILPDPYFDPLYGGFRQSNLTT